MRDGADDQDHDDVPNIMELSRTAASNRAVLIWCGNKDVPYSAAPAQGAVNPYNPCLPYTDSRTCERHPSLTNKYFPFDPEVPFYEVLN